MIQFLDHDDFKGARKSLILLSTSIILLNQLEIVGDEFSFFGVSVKLDAANAKLISIILLVYFLYNYCMLAVPRLYHFQETIQKDFYTNSCKNSRYKEQEIRVFLTKDTSHMSAEVRQQAIYFKSSKGHKRARNIKYANLMSLYIFDLGVPLVVWLFALSLVVSG